MTDRLSHDGDYKQHLAWSPDGKKFLFTRVHRGKMGLWTMNADGTELKPLLNLDTPHFDGHWSFKLGFHGAPRSCLGPIFPQRFLVGGRAAFSLYCHGRRFLGMVIRPLGLHLCDLG